MLRPHAAPSISLELVQVYLLLLFSGSWGAMIRHVYKRHRTAVISLRDFLDQYTVRRYIAVTRSDRGSIGPWFWIFSASSLLLLAVTLFRLFTDPGNPAGSGIQGDHYWPVI